MSTDKSGYRQIVKATSIFGGVQVFLIIIGIIRSKVIAVLLGPLGMGIVGMLQSTLGIIAGLTNFGLASSAVKNISTAFSENDEEKTVKIVSVFRRMVWGTGLLGVLVTLFSSQILSKITFGNKDYSWAFAILSVTLLINQISSGQSVILNALRQIRLMAKSSIIGSVLGLITTIPLYYIFGIKGIVPAIILTAISTLFLNWYFSSKLFLKKVKVNFKEIQLEGKEMLRMGFMISLSGIISLIFSYLVRIFISNYGSVDDVGLYNAGFAIVNSYVGMIFTAMATDYYPKLSAIAHDREKANKSINQQAEIAILILSPIILIFIFFIKWIVIVLYSHAFLAVDSMILYAGSGMIFKALSWAIAFLFLAKGASRLYFWNEFISNIYMLGLNILGYYWSGLKGLGISFLISYMIYAIQVVWLSKRYFKFEISVMLKKIIFFNMLITLVCLLIVLTFDSMIAYSLGIPLLIVSLYYNILNLDKRLELKEMFTELISRKKLDGKL